jgi:hypothetical protein
MSLKERLPGFVLYPFLAAVYPVLALAARNGGELVRPGDLARPLAISLAAAVVVWLASRAATSDADGRGLVTFLAMGVFSGHGYLVNTLAPWIQSDFAVFLLAVVPVAVAAVVVRRSRVSLRGLTAYLNLVLVIMVAWAAGSLLGHWRPRGPAITLSDLPKPSPGSPTSGRDDRPDLFLIVLDKYTGHRSLQANFGFDNAPFEAALEQQGFVVPLAAKANYVHTFLALAAMLNWQYLDDVAAQLGKDNANWSVAYPLLEDNRTWRALHARGYRFVFLPTGLPATDHNRYADVQLPDPARLTHEFEAVWLRGTLLYAVLQRFCPLMGCSAGVLPYVPESAESLDWKFATIPTLARSDRPVFVLAHLTVPHEPYIYDADCRHRSPYWPATDAGAEAEPVKAAYVAQIRCVNRKVETLVQEIHSQSTRPAVILLQADHGHGRLGRDMPPLSGASPAQVAERTDIFAAYLLPGAPQGLVYDSISPVNAMRAVMRYYYGLDLPPLPDESFWSSAARPYDFTRVR